MLPCERLGGDMRVSDAAPMADVSRQIAHKRLARARRGEAHATRGKGTERLVPAPLALAAETSMPVLTCARIVARRDLPRPNDADRITAEPRAHGSVTHVRYERERPGELYLIA